MGLLSGQFQDAFRAGDRRGMAEALSQQAGIIAPYMAGAGVIKAYHGSPHSFDKFKMDKIGTGEGAQAYGHGLYFAESEDVALNYRQALQQVDTAPFDRAGVPPSQWNAARMFAQNMDPTQPEAAARDFARWVGRDVTPDLVRAFKESKQPGSIYEVNINANPDDFLDWDAPLSKQPEIARKLGLRIRSENEINDEAYAIFKEYGSYEDMPKEIKNRVQELTNEVNLPGFNQTGQQLYEFGVGQQENVHGLLSGPSPNRSKELLDKGIPGIKYLDGNSRAAGEGSRNYVVFDENLINIVKKYGIAGALSAGLLTNEQAQAFMEHQDDQGAVGP